MPNHAVDELLHARRPTCIHHRLVEGLQLSVRAAVAAGLSLALAQAFKVEHPIHALIAAVIVTVPSPARTRRLGWRCLVATVVGAGCGAALSRMPPSGPPAVGPGVLVAMLACRLLSMRESARVASCIRGIGVLSYGAQPWSYACHRLLETLLGIGVAWSISLAPKLIPVEDSKPAQ